MPDKKTFTELFDEAARVDDQGQAFGAVLEGFFAAAQKARDADDE